MQGQDKWTCLHIEQCDWRKAKILAGYWSLSSEPREPSFLFFCSAVQHQRTLYTLYFPIMNLKWTDCDLWVWTWAASIHITLASLFLPSAPRQASCLMTLLHPPFMNLAVSVVSVVGVEPKCSPLSHLPTTTTTQLQLLQQWLTVLVTVLYRTVPSHQVSYVFWLCLAWFGWHNFFLCSINSILISFSFTTVTQFNYAILREKEWKTLRSKTWRNDLYFNLFLFKIAFIS